MQIPRELTPYKITLNLDSHVLEYFCQIKFFPSLLRRSTSIYCGKVKHELRVQIYELRVQIHELRVQIHEL